MSQQLDYVYFFYGLAFILLAAVCNVIQRSSASSLPWRWLGLFALWQGILDWLDLAALSMGGGRATAAVRLALMAVSFVCLWEFGRAGLSALRGKPWGRWLYVPLLASAVCGANAMMRPLRSLEDLGRKQNLDGANELLEDAERRLELCRRLLAEYLDEAKCGD